MATVTVGTHLVYVPSWTTSTNLGPLPTTAFPLDCLQSLWDFNTPGLGMPWTQMTQGCAASTCCPSGNFYTEPWAWMTSYYSPGVCPSQYRSCGGPPAPSALSSGPGETIAFCCPTNYDCPYTASYTFFLYCQSQLSIPTSVIVVDNIFDQKTLSTSSWTLPPGIGYSWQVAYPIQVRTRASDATSTSATQSTNEITSTPVSSSTSNTPAGSSSSNSSGLSGGLSPGAVSGISIGGLILTALGVFIAWRQLRLAKKDKAKSNPQERSQTLQG